MYKPKPILPEKVLTNLIRQFGAGCELRAYIVTEIECEVSEEYPEGKYNKYDEYKLEIIDQELKLSILLNTEGKFYEIMSPNRLKQNIMGSIAEQGTFILEPESDDLDIL
jgi:hypothetical protein